MLLALLEEHGRTAAPHRDLLLGQRPSPPRRAVNQLGQLDGVDAFGGGLRRALAGLRRKGLVVRSAVLFP